MRNTLITLCLVLGILFTVGAQQPNLKDQIKSFKNNKKFVAEYDKFKDQTTVTAGSFIVFQTGGREVDSTFSVYARFSFPGQNVTPVETVNLGVSCTGRRWQFLDVSKVYALIDGERVALDAARGSEIGRKSDYFLTREWLVVPMSAESFRKLAYARTVELRVGDFETKLRDDHLAAFRDLLSLSRP